MLRLCLAFMLLTGIASAQDTPTVNYSYYPNLTSWSGHVYSTVLDQNGIQHPFAVNIIFLKSKEEALERCNKAVADAGPQGFQFNGPITYSIVGPPSAEDKKEMDGWSNWYPIQYFKKKHGISMDYQVKEESPGVWIIRYRNNSSYDVAFEGGLFTNGATRDAMPPSNGEIDPGSGYIGWVNTMTKHGEVTPDLYLKQKYGVDDSKGPPELAINYVCISTANPQTLYDSMATQYFNNATNPDPSYPYIEPVPPEVMPQSRTAGTTSSGRHEAVPYGGGP